MPSGILSTILDTTGERLKERIAQSHEMDKELRDTQTDALLKSIYAVDEQGNPKLSQPEIEDAWARIEQLHKHNKDAKNILAKAREITGQIWGMVKPNPAMGQRAAQQTKDALGGGQGGGLVNAPMSEKTPIGGTSAMPPSLPAAQLSDGSNANIAAPPAPAPQALPTPPPKRSISQLSQVGSPAAAAINLENVKTTNAMKVQKQAQESAQGIAKLKLASPTTIGSYTGADDKKHYTMKALNLETGQMEYFEKDSDGNVRPVTGKFSSGSALSVTDARDLHEAHPEIPFLAIDGKPIDFDNLKLGEMLVPDPTKANHYQIASQRPTTRTIGNQVVAVPSLELANPAAQVPLGQANLGTTGTTEVPFTNARTGKTELVPTKRTTTPNTAAPATISTPGLKPPPARSGSPAESAATPESAIVPPQTQPQGRVLEDLMKPADLNAQRKFIAPIKSAAVQIFGDPANPDFRSLESFAKLADDPAAIRRIGKAGQLIINDMLDVEKGGGGVGAAALGQALSLHGGDIWTALKNTTGITNWVASTKVKATQDAVNALTPEELAYLNRAIAAYGTVVGLRSATGASGLQFSAKNMEKELPLLGLTDVVNSKSFYNKASSLAEEVVRAIRDNGINPALMPDRAFYEEAATRLSKLSKTGAVSGAGPTPPPARSGAPATRVVGGVTYYETAPGSGKWSPAPAGAAPKKFSITAGGKPYEFDTQAQLDEFKKRAGIK